MKYRASIEFEIDAEALTAHDGERQPLRTRSPSGTFSDLFTAYDQGLVSADGSLVSIEEAVEHEP